MAMNLPAKLVLGEVLAFAKAAAQSGDSSQQMAACVAVAATAEGAAEAACKRMREVLQVSCASSARVCDAFLAA